MNAVGLIIFDIINHNYSQKLSFGVPISIIICIYKHCKVYDLLGIFLGLNFFGKTWGDFGFFYVLM